MIKRFILAGQADHDNFGDSLIFVLYAKMLRAAYPESEISILNPSSVFARRVSETGIALRTIDTDSLSTAEHSVIIYVPGGYFGCPDITNIFWQLNWVDCYINKGMEAATTSKLPILIHGVEAGPLTRPFALKPMKSALSEIPDKFIYVRNEESRNYAAARFKKNVSTLPDFVLCTPAYFPKPFAQVDFDIGIHATRKFFSSKLLAKRAQSLLFDVIKKHKLSRVAIVADQVMPPDVINSVKEFSAQLNEIGVTVTIIDYEGVERLLDVISRCATIVTTKLHVGVCAISYGRKVVSFSTHPKLKRFFSGVGLEKFSMHYLFSSDRRKGELLSNVISATPAAYFSKDRLPSSSEVLEAYNTSISAFLLDTR